MDEANLPTGSQGRAGDPLPTKTGSFSILAEDGLTSLKVNGLELLDANGQLRTDEDLFVTQDVVRIDFDSISFNSTTGEYTVGVTATLLGDFVHTGDNSEVITLTFEVDIVDTNGATADGVYTAEVFDDVPEGVQDADSLAADDFGPAEGNVLANDTQGADRSVVAGVAAGTTGVAAVDATTVDAVIDGTYGELTIDALGNYSYTRNPGTPGDVQDVFTYTLLDEDGDTNFTTLTISIGDAPVTLDLPVTGEDDGTVVDEAGLPARDGDLVGEPAGSSEPEAVGVDTASTSGEFFFTAPDGPAIVSVDGSAISAGDTFTGDHGTLTIDAVNAGSVEYTYVLTDNTSGDDTSDSFAVLVQDQDDDLQPG
ncbi:MAG: VCBS domain-containing protein, partial [Halieaceae bacterium]